MEYDQKQCRLGTAEVTWVASKWISGRMSVQLRFVCNGQWSDLTSGWSCLLVQASLRSKVEFIIVNLEFNLTWFVSSEFWHVLTTSFLGNYDWGIKPEMAEEFSGN